MMELHIQQEELVWDEISTASQQMSLRAELHQRLLHLESYTIYMIAQGTHTNRLLQT